MTCRAAFVLTIVNTFISCADYCNCLSEKWIFPTCFSWTELGIFMLFLKGRETCKHMAHQGQ